MSASTYDGRKPEPPYPTDQDELDALRAKVAELEAELDALRQERDALLLLLEDAPHADFCGAPSSSGANVNPCRCWKKQVDAAIDAARSGE